MKRHKRDMEERAWNRGYNIGVKGKSRELCPFSDINNRQYWIGGWRQGREDNWNGLTGIAGVGRAPL